MFINFSNHPYVKWAKTQQEAAAVFGDVMDIPFPHIPPQADTQDVQALARQHADEILSYHPDAVMCQGEMTFTFHLVRLLKEHGIRVVCGTTQRLTKEVFQDGKLQKISQFEFVQFREY